MNVGKMTYLTSLRLDFEDRDVEVRRDFQHPGDEGLDLEEDLQCSDEDVEPKSETVMT